MDNQTHDAAAAVAVPSRRRLSVVLPVVVGFAMLGLLLWSAWPVVRPAREVVVTQAVFDRSSQAAPDINEAEETDTRRDVPTVQAAGWLEAEPYYVAVAALADGVVETIEVLEGEYVEKDQVVARLVDEDSILRERRARAELNVAEANVTRAAADLTAAQRSWDEPVELERRVEAGRAALAEARGELAQLPSHIAAARADATRLDETHERIAAAAEEGATTALEVIIARERAAAQRAQVESLERREPILRARVDRLRADLRAAERDIKLRIEDRRRLDAAKADELDAQAALERAQALYDEAALELERMTVRAPVSGYVQTRLKIPGDKVVTMMDSPESAHVAHIYDPERLQVRVDVPLADASHVFKGQPCEVVVEVLPDRAFEGVVLRTLHEADLQKNTLEVQVKVLDPDPVLRPEMLSRVKFLPSRRDGSTGDRSEEARAPEVLVPSGALDKGSGSVRVWVVTDRRNGRGVLRSRGVRVINESEGWARVSGDVAAGALIAVGVVSAKDGERVVFRGKEGGAS